MTWCRVKEIAFGVIVAVFSIMSLPIVVPIVVLIGPTILGMAIADRFLDKYPWSRWVQMICVLTAAGGLVITLLFIFLLGDALCSETGYVEELLLTILRKE